MTYITKPKVHHPALQRNEIGLTRRDYEGTLTTLCAGCGHDSITAGIIQAFWELSIEPHKVAKLSGIGCSSKTPAYFLREAHGFNGVHGRISDRTRTDVGMVRSVWELFNQNGDKVLQMEGYGMFRRRHPASPEEIAQLEASLARG